MLYIMQTGKYHQNHITTKKYFHNMTFSSLMIKAMVVKMNFYYHRCWIVT